MQGCTLLPNGLQAQSSIMTPLPTGPGHILWQMTLGGLRGLVGVGHVPRPVNHGLSDICPDGVCTEYMQQNWGIYTCFQRLGL